MPNLAVDAVEFAIKTQPTTVAITGHSDASVILAQTLQQPLAVEPVEFVIRPQPTLTPITTVGAAVVLVPVPGGQGPRGFPGTGVPVFGEIPTGVLDGVNTVFTTTHDFQTISVYLNGLRESHYTATSPTITIADPPLPTDDIRVDYIIQ